jgi:hypothetical protein
MYTHRRKNLPLPDDDSPRPFALSAKDDIAGLWGSWAEPEGKLNRAVRVGELEAKREVGRAVVVFVEAAANCARQSEEIED